MRLSAIAAWHTIHGFTVVPTHGKRALTRWGREAKQYYNTPGSATAAFRQTYTYKDRMTGETTTTRPDGIGIICEPSNLVVIDCDSDDAVEWARALVKRSAIYPKDSIGLVQSPREGGGLHLYFRQRGGMEPLRQCHGGLHPKVDLKAHGSLVVAAGSLHRTGDRYQIRSSKADFQVDRFPLAPMELYAWQKKKDEQAGTWDRDVSNHEGFEGTLFYHHVKVFSGGGTKLHIQCPNWQNHSKQDQSGTVLFQANKLYGLGRVHCEHSSCNGLTSRDYKGIIGDELVNETERRLKNG